MRTIRNHFYASDLRHIDMIQYLTHYCLDIDNLSYHNMSTPNCKMLIEFKHIHKGFDSEIKQKYRIKDLISMAGDRFPAIVIYVSPGPLPSHLECNKHYAILEQGYGKKYTTYSHWNFLIQPLNKLGAELIDNKKVKAFSLRGFYQWLCLVNKKSINQDLLSQLSVEYSIQFKSFVQSVLAQM